jgi:hypothetical protein
MLLVALCICRRGRYMAFVGYITKKINVFSRNFLRKASTVVDVGRLKKNIKDEEENIECLYQKVGKIIYEKYVSNVDMDDNLVEICEKISIHQESVQELKNEVLKVQDLKICTNCKKEISKSAVHCFCGLSQETDVEGNSENVIICAQCGSNNNRISKVCDSCGGGL